MAQSGGRISPRNSRSRLSYSTADMSKPEAFARWWKSPAIVRGASTFSSTMPVSSTWRPCRHSDRKMGRDSGDQSLFRLSYDAARPASDDPEPMGAYRQHRIRPRPRGVALQVRLRRCQARRGRADQSDGIGDRGAGHHLQRDLSRAMSTRPWSRRRSMTRPKHTLFRANRSSAMSCWHNSRTNVLRRSRSSGALAVFWRAMRPPRSPEWPCRSTAAGPPTRDNSDEMGSAQALGIPPLSGEHRWPFLVPTTPTRNASAIRRSKATGGRVGSLRGARLLQRTPPGSLCSPDLPFQGGITALAEAPTRCNAGGHDAGHHRHAAHRGRKRTLRARKDPDAKATPGRPGVSGRRRARRLPGRRLSGLA